MGPKELTEAHSKLGGWRSVGMLPQEISQILTIYDHYWSFFKKASLSVVYYRAKHKISYTSIDVQMLKASEYCYAKVPDQL